MPRPDRSQQRRQQWIPELARAFAEFGYRRTTTALLAERCGVRENVLYRLWPDKRAMFVAAIDHVYRVSEAIWSRLPTEAGSKRQVARALLEYEAEHHGEFGLYRIIFAGLSETDDELIRAALCHMYERFRHFIERQVEAHREEGGASGPPDAALTAWAILGLGTAANIGRELGLLGEQQRKRLFTEVGRRLLDGGET